MLNIRRGGMFYALFPNQEDGNKFSNKLTIVLDVEGNSVIVVPCTTVTSQEENYKKCIQIGKNSAEGIAMNLRDDSLIMIDRLDPMPFNIFINKHDGGTVPESLLQKIEEMLEDEN